MIANANRILWLPEGDARNWDYESGGWASSNRNPSGVRIDAESALRATVVLACVRVLSASVAGLPLHLYRRLAGGGKELARDVPLYRVLHTTPNDWQTSYEWRETLMLHLLLHGSAFCEIRGAGPSQQLLPLHPSRMKVDRLENGRLRYTYREDKGSSTVYSQDAIMHLRWLSDDSVNGIVPVEIASDAIGLARACEIHGASFFGNGARPGVILSTDQMLSPEAAENTRNQWERAHRGPDRAQRTAVLQGGLKVNELGGNNQESQFLESRRFQVEEVCRIYGVPPHLVGDLSRSSFSNIEQQSLDYVQNGLMPWLRRFESAISRDLLTDDETFAEFDVRGALRADAAGRSAFYNTMAQLGVFSVNEIRGFENLNPVDGGDIRVVPLNMQTLEQANAAATLAMAPAAEPVVEEIVVDEPATPADAPTVLGVLDQYRQGAITIEAAKALLQAAFPQTPEVMVDTILAGVVVPEPEPEPVAQEPVPEPVAPDSEPLAASLPASRAMTLSIDFDRTFAADPSLWGEFARKAVADGNTVVMVSRRPDTPENQQEVGDTLGDYREAFAQVLLVGERLKDEAAREAGIEVDVWVDDSPQFVRSEPEPPAEENAYGYGKLKKKPTKRAAQPPRGRLPVTGRDCGTGSGGFKPGNKCAGEGGAGESDSGGGGSSGAGDDSVGTGGGGASGPAHSEGSDAYKAREDHRTARRTEDYPEVRPSEDHTAVRHTVGEPKYDSNGQYIKPSDPSDWTPERQAMHREIIADATAGVPRSEEPTLYMMGGGPAAGKSSIIKNGDVKHPEKHVLANPDEFKADLPEYRDGLAAGDPRAARVSHEESSYLNKQVINASADGGLDVVWDGTGDNSVDKLEQQIRVLKDRGYKVQADYVTCDTETAVERSNARGKKTGRFVPEEAVRETHASVSEIWPEAVARGLFDRSDLYDTTSGGKPVLVATARGTTLEVKDQAAYQRFLDKAKRGKRSRRKSR